VVFWHAFCDQFCRDAFFCVIGEDPDFTVSDFQLREQMGFIAFSIEVYMGQGIAVMGGIQHAENPEFGNGGRELFPGTKYLRNRVSQAG
jgi:hypothetical protein